jgi:uncharacterized integral membrane protein
MRKFLSGLVLIPLGVLFVVFAVANRHQVTVSFDPFNSTNPSVGVTMPLFVVIIAVAILGVVAGGMATWVRQRHWRRAARQHEAEARQVRAQLDDMRSRVMTPARSNSPRLAAPAREGAGIGFAGRDKHGATL